MKKEKILIVFLVLLYIKPFLFSDTFSKNQLIPSDNWIYDALLILKNESKKASLINLAPLSVEEISFFLSNVDYSLLSDNAQHLYRKIELYLETEKKSFQIKPFSVALYPEFNLNFLCKTEDDIDWSFGTDYTGKSAYSYESKEYISADYGAASNYYGNILTKPPVILPVYLNFSDFIFVESDFFVGKKFFSMSKNDNFVNIPLASDEFEFMWPNFSYASAGHFFDNGYGINFTVGKQGLQFGRTQTGSIILNDTFQTDFYVQFEIYSDKLRYYMDVVEVDHTKYLYLHSFDLLPFSNLRISAVEGTLINDSFELRYLNPLMIMHSFGSWNEYMDDSERRYYREAHVCAYLGLAFDFVPFRNFRIYGLMAQNEIQPPWELTNDYGKTVPNGIGFQIGAEYDIPLDFLDGAYLKNTIEFVYTSPYLYIKQGADWSLYREGQDINSSEYKVYSWIGSPFGPDCFAFQAKTELNSFERMKFSFSYLFCMHGENSFAMLHQKAESEKKEYYAYYPSVLKLLGLISQEEAENIARNMWLSGTISCTNRFTVQGEYRFFEKLSAFVSASYSFIYNNRNIKNNFAYGFEFSTTINYKIFN